MPLLPPLLPNSADVAELGKYKLRSTGGKVVHEKDMHTEYRDSRGQRKCVGGRDLKGSQTYPRGFGQAWAQVCDAHHEADRIAEVCRRAHIMHSPGVLDSLVAALDDHTGDVWADARVPEVLQVLF